VTRFRALACLAVAATIAPAACSAQGAQGGAAGVRQAESLRRASRYEEAISAFRALADSPATPGARRGLLRSLAAVGRYEEAERLGRAYVATAGGAESWATLGEVLAARGRLAAAESAFVRGSGSAPDSLRARLGAAVLRWRRGERASALGAFDAFIDLYNERRSRLTAEELTAIAEACRYLGDRDPQLFKDALRAFDEAIAADPSDPEPRVLLADLFLSKYNAEDAEGTIREALRLAPDDPRALLVAARRAHFDGSGEAMTLVRRALDVNPSLVEARVFLGTLLLDSEDRAAAVAEAERALAVNPSSVEALALLASARLVAGDERGFAEAERRARAIDPRPASLYVTAAELAGRHRLYERAVTLARAGVEVDSTSWRAQAAYGLALMRLGRPAEARRALETSFAGDPYDVWVKNTLDLLDTYKEYEEVDTRRFRLMLDRKESALLAPYLGALLEEGYDRLAERYGYRPPTPIRLELFRSHGDFSVRTVGLAGLGALGVSFGGVLAMDSPAARPPGAFNWGSTAWHELAHAFTLGMTSYRVPRWLSEGISVYEERRARPGWGAGPSLEFLAAYKAGALAPVSRLNDGFVRPRWPQQVVLSYYQASLVCELIERDFGAGALVAMLRGYRDGLSTDEVFRRVLKVEPAELDRRFDAYVRQRFAAPLASIRVAGRGATDSGPPPIEPPRAGPPPADDFIAQLAQGRALAEGGRGADAVPFLERAKALFPEYAAPDSPRRYLARIHEARGDLRAAEGELAALTARSEHAHEALLALARVRETLGDRAGAAAALERALWVTPYDPALHERLATLYEATGDAARAVRERRAVVALGPVDRAEALYRLALAHERAGERDAARRTVLQALEEAPNFERAQDLLLRLTGGGA
jgi:tetratricopeptide (TPR) repeat protein